jgi:hypothetical protein
MPWGLVEPEKRYKDFLVEADTAPAKTEHFCAVDCGQKIHVGDGMQFVRLSATDWTAMHLSCWEALPDRPEAAFEAAPEAREVYATGQLQRATGVAEYLTQQGTAARVVPLPAGERRRGRHYVVHVDEGETQLSLAQAS